MSISLALKRKWWMGHNMPSSGVVNFLAIHETYHVGQASYLRGWLRHKGLIG